MFSVIGAILAIGFLIIVHEAGHYFVARWCGMRVDRFSIGFGPALLSWRRGETDFTLGAIPFGGFVLINGATPADEIDPDDPNQYPNKPVWQRFAAIFAGPATNYLTAIILALGLYAIAGVPNPNVDIDVDEPVKGSPAAGVLEKGDRILAVNGEQLYLYRDGVPGKALWTHVEESKGSELNLRILRDGKEMDVAITPVQCGEGVEFCSKQALEKQAWQLGVKLAYTEEGSQRKDVGIVKAVGHAFYYPVIKTKEIGKGLYDIVTGRVKGELAGPVGIATIAKKQFDAGWVYVISFLMVLNVYLGLFNLLPLPALDGGRLVFLSYEMATRRRANQKVEAMVHMVGFTALMLVMVLVTYKDIANLF